MASFEAELPAGLRDNSSPVTAEPIVPGSGEAAIPRHDESLRAQSYQELFRAIGSMLDEETTSSIGIVEVEDGFLVRAERPKQLLVEVSVNHLPRVALSRRADEMRRIRPPSGKRHHPGVWGNLPVTHQDFFRALGYELDSVGARHVIIDELSDGLLLRYEQEGNDGGGPIRRQLSLGRTEIEEILNDAVRRRRIPQEGKPSDYFRTHLGGAGESIGQNGSVEWILQRTNLPYQEMLRGLGRALDEQGAARVCVLEMPDGFAVRYQSSSHGGLRWAHFTDDALAPKPENRHKPASGGFFRRPAVILPPPMPDGYSDLLRALGYELQRSDVSCIFIAEQDHGLAVSYQYREKRQQMTARRTVRVLSESELQQLTAEARARRGRNEGARGIGR